MENIASTKPYTTSDLRLIALLLCMADLTFEGTLTEQGKVFAKFSPFERAEVIVNGYYIRQAPPVQARDLLERFEDARNIVFRALEARR